VLQKHLNYNITMADTVAGLAGNTPYEQAQVNMIALTVEDAFYKPSLLIFQAADDATEVSLG
jgi:hypothetical protein